jgi:hypothetical protein
VPTSDEKWIGAQADRPPTDDEARAAERVAADVDVEAVAEHAQEMAELGANVEGEGQIGPPEKS